MTKQSIKNVSIIGMGALGLMYGAHISDHLSADAVTFIMDNKRFEKYENTTFTVNEKAYQFQMASANEAKAADLLIVAVKYTGLEEALDVMKNCIGPDTIIISVLNGISSESIIASRYGMNQIIHTVAQGMDAMKFQNSLHYTQMGELHIGITESSRQPLLECLAQFFDQIKMPYVTENDILYRMWGKFMLNVGINQTCMVYDTNYAGALAEGEANRTMVAAMREVLSLANLEGVQLSEKDLTFYVNLLHTLSPEGMPSMAQDRINKKYSEVDMFAGAVMELAKKHNMFVPTNLYLYQKAKEIEAGY